MQANLVPVPATLLQGSLALGSLLQGVVGEVRPGGSIPVHPMVIAGWAGLVSTAFNLLPVGCTDGGRMCQVLLSHPSPDQTLTKP
jgi:membrane-associated protease RseP (regulator of RpoE activity)